MADASKERIQETLRSLSVETECGLYTLVDTVCRRALAEPDQISWCANVCLYLVDMQLQVWLGLGQLGR